MATETAHPPSFPFAREHTYLPPAENAKLRNHDPVSQVQLYDGTKAWIVMKHDDIYEALASDDLSADRRHPGYPEIHAGGHRAKEARPTFVNLDDPEHQQQRDMLQGAFDPEAVERLRPMMRGVVDKCLDNLVDKGKKSQPVDLMEEFAIPVPTQIVFKFLGVPEEDVDELARDSEVRHSTSRNAAETSNVRLQSYMRKLVDQREQSPQDDLIRKLIVEQLRPDNLDKDDVVTLAFLVLTAGNAALLNSIGLGVITFLSHPDQLAQLKRDPSSLAPAAVNELLRYNTTSALNSRRATKTPITIDGIHHIPKNTGLICSVQSGDRDRLDTNEPDPDTFDLHRRRDPGRVLAFGHGPHRCQAEAFTKMQLEIVFASLFARLPNFELARRPEDIRYAPKEQNAGVLELPVFF